MEHARIGSIVTLNNKVHARITWTGDDGQLHTTWRSAESASHAKEIIKHFPQDIEDWSEQSAERAVLTFAQLADYFAKSDIPEARYVDGCKVPGKRKVDAARPHLRTLREHFDNHKLRDITPRAIERYIAKRLTAPTYRGSQPSMAAVSRELTLLRRMLNVALGEGWISKNPLGAEDSFARSADERNREHVVTKDEKARLLVACRAVRPRLMPVLIRPILICALDTGMSRTEMMMLKWQDVDFDDQRIKLPGINTATWTPRTVKMTERLARELWALREMAEDGSEALVFELVKDLKESPQGAPEMAEPRSKKFHDLRRGAAIHMIKAGISIAVVARLLGHADITVTYRYLYVEANKNWA